jgi:hypothetical protein
MLCPHCGKEIAEYTSGQPLYLPNPVANAASGGYGGVITIVSNPTGTLPYVNTICAAVPARAEMIQYITI